MSYKVLFLDLDGTLLDSVGLKNEALCQVLEMFGIPKFFASNQIADSIAKPRNIRLIEVWENYFNKPLTQELLNSMLNQLSRILRSKDVELISGAEMLLTNRNLAFRKYIVTAAVNSEVEAILNKFNWSVDSTKVFADVLDKGILFKSLITSENLNSFEVLAVGDTVNDLRAAEFAEIDFWMISKDYAQYEKLSSNFTGGSVDLNGLITFLLSMQKL